jgi:hypothetical protein
MCLSKEATGQRYRGMRVVEVLVMSDNNNNVVELTTKTPVVKCMFYIVCEETSEGWRYSVELGKGKIPPKKVLRTVLLAAVSGLLGARVAKKLLP